MNTEQPPERELLLAAMAYGAATGRITASSLLSPAELVEVARSVAQPLFVRGTRGSLRDVADKLRAGGGDRHRYECRTRNRRR